MLNVNIGRYSDVNSIRVWAIFRSSNNDIRNLNVIAVDDAYMIFRTINMSNITQP